MLQFFPSGQDDKLLYTPNSTFNDKLIESVRLKLQIFEESKFYHTFFQGQIVQNIMKS